jgi:hypothetical protein
MGETAKTGTIWGAEELDAIVADYFAMLAKELVGEPYVKSKHSAALMRRIGRSHRSVEFKHQNISAVLNVLGMPWIKGYVPKENFQNAIFPAIERYLDGHREVLNDLPFSAALPVSDSVFVPAPELSARKPLPSHLQRLVRKFDPVERDRKNRSLGRAGEEFVWKLEVERLTRLDRGDLARRVRWVAAEDGDGAGYDVFSFRPDGQENLIEVKTTNGAARTPFFLSRNECDLASERPADWRIYRVHLFAQEPRIFAISPPLDKAVNLSAETWRASF